MQRAKYEILDDKSFYGEIPGFKGLYANESTLEDCRSELEHTLEDWILLSFSKNLPLPRVGKIQLKVGQTSNT
jgi:predicted RNase H-like HicB family nuclease